MACRVGTIIQRLSNMNARVPSIFCGRRSAVDARANVSASGPCEVKVLCRLAPPGTKPSAGERGALYGHVARNNDQWRKPARGESLAIVRGPDAYVSPSWYAAKTEHGRVVPTWNYVTAHVYGRLVVHLSLIHI